MLDLTKSLTLALALGVALPAAAQDTTAPAADTATAPAAAQPAQPAQPAQVDPTMSMGIDAKAPPKDGPGSMYVQSTFDSWQLRCIHTEDGSDPCQLYQLLKDDKGNDVAEISLLALPAGGQAAAGATIVVPLETLLPEGLALTVDGGQNKRYPFTFCAAIGCVARVGFTDDEIGNFKKGAKGTLTVVPVAAPDKKVTLNVSLAGFTAAYDALQKTLPTK